MDDRTAHNPQQPTSHTQRPLGLIIYCQPNAGLYEASALLGPSLPSPHAATGGECVPYHANVSMIKTNKQKAPHGD